MTIICCLPSLPVEVFWHLLTPLQRYIPPTVRLETSRLNSLPSWVKSRAIEYAFTRACFHAGEIRVLDSSLCTKLSCIGEARRFVGRSFNFQKRKRLDRCSVRQQSRLPSSAGAHVGTAISQSRTPFACSGFDRRSSANSVAPVANGVARGSGASPVDCASSGNRERHGL